MSDETKILQRYPLLCGFRELVAGDGFIAAVEVNGRVLAEQEADGWWIYRVNPGGIAESGATLQEAHANLRQAFRLYLFDVAKESSTFEAFEEEVKRFFDETNGGNEQGWDQAVKDVRAGKITAPDLPQQPAESPLFIRVHCLKKPSPSANQVEAGPSVAA